MATDETITNRVAGSGLVTLNLEEHFPANQIVELDLKELLVGGLMLREKDLREFVRTRDWGAFQDKVIAVYCSTDAIIPTWAYMLIAIAAQPYAARVVFGNLETALVSCFKDKLDAINWSQYQDAKVVVKGCSDVAIPAAVYLDVAARLRGVASSIMYGEQCSTVPLFKRQKSGA